MRRSLSILAALIAILALAAPVGAITNGSPDAGEHPYVGEMLFYVPDAVDSRFDDPGSWFTCTRHPAQLDDRRHGRPLHVRRRPERRLDDARRRRHGRGSRRCRRQRRLDQLRGGAGLQHPAAELGLRPRPERAALPGLDGRPEREPRVASRRRRRPIRSTTTWPSSSTTPASCGCRPPSRGSPTFGQPRADRLARPVPRPGEEAHASRPSATASSGSRARRSSAATRGASPTPSSTT